MSGDASGDRAEQITRALEMGLEIGRKGVAAGVSMMSEQLEEILRHRVEVLALLNSPDEVRAQFVADLKQQVLELSDKSLRQQRAGLTALADHKAAELLGPDTDPAWADLLNKLTEPGEE